MPVKVDKISVDFKPYTETVNVATKKCNRYKQVKDIDCFRRCYYPSKHSSYYYVRYSIICSACLDERSLKG